MGFIERVRNTRVPREKLRYCCIWGGQIGWRVCVSSAGHEWDRSEMCSRSNKMGSRWGWDGQVWGQAGVPMGNNVYNQHHKCPVRGFSSFWEILREKGCDTKNRIGSLLFEGWTKGEHLKIWISPLYYLYFFLISAQDIDGANVEDVCSSVSLTHKTRLGPNKLPTGKCHGLKMLIGQTVKKLASFGSTDSIFLTLIVW